MGVAINGASASNSINSNGAGGTAITFNFTCPALTDCLVLGESMTSAGTGTGLPTSVTYNGVNFTNVPGSLQTEASTPSQCSLWQLTAANGLVTGSSLLVSITYPSGVGVIAEQVTCLQGLIGTDQSGPAPVGTPNIQSGNSAAAAAVPTGAGANDLYLGLMWSQNTTSVSGGSQTLIRATTARGTNRQSLDQAIAGAGAFGWTITNGIWVASAVAFLAPSGAGQQVSSMLTIGNLGPN